MTRRLPPTHRLWCDCCGFKTPHRQRADLDVPTGALGLFWECERCGHRETHSAYRISVSERLDRH